MDIKYLNILDNTFDNGSLASLIGGASSTTNFSSKYILLSCPEFEDTVNSIINLDGGNVTKKENEIYLDYLDSLEFQNSQNKKLSLSSFNLSLKNPDELNKEYERFLDDIGLNLNNKLKEDNKKIKKENINAPLYTYKTSPSIKKLKDDEKNKALYVKSKSNIETNHYYRGFINWKTYGDKTPDIKMNADTVKKLKGGKVIFFAYFSFNEPDATPIMNQLLFLNSLNHYGVAEINIVLPYFPVGTMERIVGEGETPTGYALAQMINSIPSGSSKNTIYIFDIHALCSRFFFHTNAIPVLVTLMPEYLKYIKTTFPEKINNLNIIVFPDDGAKKRFEKLLDKDTKTITCSKVRIGDDRKIKIDEGIEQLLESDKKTLKNTNINLFIIDDLVQSGSTLMTTVDELNTQIKTDYDKQNNTTVSFYTLVTHSIFPTKNEDGKIELFQKQNIEKLITSDSRPLKIKEIQKELLTDGKTAKLQVISIAPICHEIFINGEYKSSYIAPYSIN
jgi:phosphoribosylpyrophosphate synthetase